MSPVRAGECARAAGAPVPPRGRAAALRARGAGGSAAGVPAEPGATESGPEERGKGEGEDRGPAEAAAALETPPPEQPAHDHSAGWAQGEGREGEGTRMNGS